MVKSNAGSVSGTYTAPADGMFLAVGAGTISGGSSIKVNDVQWPKSYHYTSSSVGINASVAFCHKGDLITYSASGSGSGNSYAKFIELY